MTDEEIAQLRAQATNARSLFTPYDLTPVSRQAASTAEWAVHFADMTLQLLAEVERMREVVRVVADGEINDEGGYSTAGYCRCNPEAIEEPWNEPGAEGAYWTYWRHQPECVFTKARAILGQ